MCFIYQVESGSEKRTFSVAFKDSATTLSVFGDDQTFIFQPFWLPHSLYSVISHPELIGIIFLNSLCLPSVLLLPGCLHLSSRSLRWVWRWRSLSAITAPSWGPKAAAYSTSPGSTKSKSSSQRETKVLQVWNTTNKRSDAIIVTLCLLEVVL